MAIQIILITLGILILSFIWINLKAKKTYPNINSEIRTAGYIANLIMDSKNEEDFIRSVKKENAKDIKCRLPKNVIYKEEIIKDENGKKIPVVIYQKAGQETNATGLLYIHGGGYLMGSPKAQNEVNLICDFIRETNTVVIAPTYTLSLVAPYPAGLDDCYQTLLWMKKNSSSLGINPSQIFTAGISAGGGLTAALGLYARDKNEVNIAFQMPLYPMLDDRMILPSAQENNNILWDSRKNQWGWKYYLDDLYMTDDVPIYASPSRAKDYSNLPPTYTFIGAEDTFYDETKLYVENLKRDGVHAKFHIYEGGFHTFEITTPYAKISKEARANLLQVYVYATKHYFSS